MNDELVQVWRQHDGSWRWRYVVLDHTELRSNRGYQSADEAIHSARLAYPSVAILGPIDQVSSTNGKRHREPNVIRTALISASAVFVVLAAWYAVRQRWRLMRRRR